MKKFIGCYTYLYIICLAFSFTGCDENKPAVSVRVDLSQSQGAVRDLFGVNKNPRAPESASDGTLYNVEPLYGMMGVSYVRTHDCEVDLCGTYLDATMYDMATDPPSAIQNACTPETITGMPHLKWNVNDPAGVDDPENYDFTEVDAVIQNALASGAAIYLRLGQKYNGPSDTDNPAAWAKVAVNIYRHIIGDFKPSGVFVDPVTVEVYNEPDGGFWQSSKNSFYIFFNNTVDGVRAAAADRGKTVRIGGPGFTNEVNNHFGDVRNVASSFIDEVTIDRLDFISAHHYNDCDNASLEKAVGWFDTVRASLEAKGYPAGKPIDISEYNIGLGKACGQNYFSEPRLQSFTSGMLTLMQQGTEWNIERAMFYAGFPNMSLIELNSKSSGAVTVNPDAWALWAHSRLKEGQLLSSSTCVQGRCASGRDTATSPLLSLAAAMGTGDSRIVVTNNTALEQNYELDLTGISSSPAQIVVYTPFTEPREVSATMSGSEYTVDDAAVSEMMAEMTRMEKTMKTEASGSASIELTVPAYGIHLIEVNMK